MIGFGLGKEIEEDVRSQLAKCIQSFIRVSFLCCYCSSSSISVFSPVSQLLQFSISHTFVRYVSFAIIGVNYTFSYSFSHALIFSFSCVYKLSFLCSRPFLFGCRASRSSLSSSSFILYFVFGQCFSSSVVLQ